MQLQKGVLSVERSELYLCRFLAVDMSDTDEIVNLVYGPQYS